MTSDGSAQPNRWQLITFSSLHAAPPWTENAILFINIYFAHKIKYHIRRYKLLGSGLQSVHNKIAPPKRRTRAWRDNAAWIQCSGHNQIGMKFRFQYFSSLGPTVCARSMRPRRRGDAGQLQRSPLGNRSRRKCISEKRVSRQIQRGANKIRQQIDSIDVYPFTYSVAKARAEWAKAIFYSRRYYRSSFVCFAHKPGIRHAIPHHKYPCVVQPFHNKTRKIDREENEQQKRTAIIKSVAHWQCWMRFSGFDDGRLASTMNVRRPNARTATREDRTKEKNWN